MATKSTEEPSPEVEKSSTSAAPLSSATKDYKSDLPIDRGYAWVIVFACLCTNVICLGLQRAYGILFVEFLYLFGLPVGVTSLILAIQSAFMSVAGLLAQTVMLSLLSERQTLIIGSVVGALGIILSYFANSLFVLIFTQSVLVGSANGMIMGPTMVIVGKYFHKRRSLAMAVATLGGNLGSMIMPLFTEALLDTYGVRGTFLVMGATFLNIMVFAGLLRPLDLTRRQRRKSNVSPTDEELLNQTEKGGVDPQRRSLCDEDSHHPNPLKGSSHLCVSTPEVVLATQITVELDDSNVDKNEDHDLELQPLRNGDSSDKTQLHQSNNSNKNRVTNSSSHLPHDQKKNTCLKFLAMFDFSLFKQPPFLLVLISCSLAFLPAALYGMYLPALAMDKGMTGQKAALLLTIFGGCGIVSRLGFGYLADLNCIRRFYLMALLMTLSCTAGLFTPLYTTFTLLMIFSITYGLFGVIFFSLMPVVVVDLMGLNNMSKTLGFVQLFQGVVTAAAHPIIGYLRDVTGYYHASYYFLSGAGLMCAFTLLFTPLVTRHQPTVKRTMSQEQT